MHIITLKLLHKPCNIGMIVMLYVRRYISGGLSKYESNEVADWPW